MGDLGANFGRENTEKWRENAINFRNLARKTPPTGGGSALRAGRGAKPGGKGLTEGASRGGEGGQKSDRRNGPWGRKGGEAGTTGRDSGGRAGRTVEADGTPSPPSACLSVSRNLALRGCSASAPASRRIASAPYPATTAFFAVATTPRAGGWPVFRVSVVGAGRGCEITEKRLRDYGKQRNFAAKFGCENTEKRGENASNFRNLARKSPLRREGTFLRRAGGGKEAKRPGRRSEPEGEERNGRRGGKGICEPGTRGRKSECRPAGEKRRYGARPIPSPSPSPPLA